jgi:hypothetical protein
MKLKLWINRISKAFYTRLVRQHFGDYLSWQECPKCGCLLRISKQPWGVQYYCNICSFKSVIR